MPKNNLIRFDWAAKRLLRQKTNFVVLEGLLSTLLEEPIRIVRMLESEGNQENVDDKFNRVDMVAENSRGELVIIEIQNNRELDYFHRMLYGVAKAITEYINVGDPYSKIKKVYSVNIVYFDLGQGNDYVYHGRTEFLGIHGGDILKLSAKQQTQFVYKEAGKLYPEYYILRVDDFDEQAATPLDEWISFLKTGKISDEATAPGLFEAKERLQIDNLSPEEKQSYYVHMENMRYQCSVIQTGWMEGKDEGRTEGLIEGRAEGLIEGRAEGRAEGEKAKALIIARNALKKGMSPEDVMDLTGLEKEDLDSLTISQN
jgi:predicted transposase/invertase (TIGR01784 family)